MRITVLALILSAVSVPASGQTPEEDVTAAVKRTIDAYNKGDTTAFQAMFMPTVREFYIDNSVLTSTDDIQPTPVPGGEPKPSVAVRQLSVRVYGTTAVVAGYFVGTLYDGTQAKQGTWRFTETRVKDGNTWKVVQFHFSPLAP